MMPNSFQNQINETCFKANYYIFEIKLKTQMYGILFYTTQCNSYIYILDSIFTLIISNILNKRENSDDQINNFYLYF